MNSWPWLKNEPLEWELILKQDVLNIILSYYPDLETSELKIERIDYHNNRIFFSYYWNLHFCSIFSKNILGTILTHHPDFDSSQIEIKEVDYKKEMISFYYLWELYACSINKYEKYSEMIDEIRRQIDESIQKK